jgi:hypothetical protein
MSKVLLLRLLARASACGLFALAAACGGEDGGERAASGCAAEARADAYRVGLEKAGATGLRVRLMEARPGPPDRGDNLWALELVDAAGAPVTTATISARPWMPDHGHGSTPQRHAARPGATAGAWELGPFNLFMPGLWTVTLDVETPAGADAAVFAFCIEG